MPDAKLSVQNQDSYDDDTEPRFQRPQPTKQYVDTMMLASIPERKLEITEVPKSLKRLTEKKPVEVAGATETDIKTDIQEKLV